MNKFGQIKCKLLSKLTESYTKDNKTEIKNILSLMKENKDLKELYLLYEDIENKYFKDKEVAKYYVEELSKSLNGKAKSLSSTLKKLDESIGLVETKYITVYDYVDCLLEEDNLLNIDTKVRSKMDLVDYITTKKEITESNQVSYSENQKLLYAVLANNFNVLYSNTLNEEQKNELKSIVSLTDDEVQSKTKELKESILNKINNLISESTDTELRDKLNKVVNEVNTTTSSKYNFYKLKELENGLN
jgi:hypothetical protein